jgi:hypothetical protein
VKFAVARAWKDNPGELQVVEYFNTVEECEAFIRLQKKSPAFKWTVCEYV